MSSYRTRYFYGQNPKLLHNPHPMLQLCAAAPGGDRDRIRHPLCLESLSCARHRCLDGNGSPRAAWLFFSFEAACKEMDRRTSHSQQITVSLCEL